MSGLRIATADVPALEPRLSAASERAGLGILVVDNDDLIRSLLELFFCQHRGIPVWLAAGGEEAVRIFRAHGADIGLAFVDVQMPGLDGPQTCSQLKELCPALPLYFMTGNMAPYTQEDLLRCGAIDIIAKPFRLASLEAIAAQHLLPIPDRVLPHRQK